MGRLRNSVIKRYRKAIDGARNALGFEIEVYYKTGIKIECGSCTFDPVNKESTNLDCEECAGNYYFDEIKTRTLIATTSRVGVAPAWAIAHLPGGSIDVNDVYISCKLSDALIDPADESGNTIFHQATKIIVNGDTVIPKTSPLKYGLAGDLYNCALLGTIDPTI